MSGSSPKSGEWAARNRINVGLRRHDGPAGERRPRSTTAQQAKLSRLGADAGRTCSTASPSTSPRPTSRRIEDLSEPGASSMPAGLANTNRALAAAVARSGYHGRDAADAAGAARQTYSLKERIALGQITGRQPGHRARPDPLGPRRARRRHPGDALPARRASGDAARDRAVRHARCCRGCTRSEGGWRHRAGVVRLDTTHRSVYTKAMMKRNYPRTGYERARDSLKRRGAGDGAEGVEEVLALLASGGEDAGADGRGLGAPGGAEAADDLAVDDGGAQVALGAVVGGLDVVAVQEDVEAVAVGAVALLEPSGLGLRRDVAVEHQPIGGVLDEQPAACERLGGDLLALMVQADRAAEDVPELDRPEPRLAGVGLDREGQVALLVAQADLVLGRPGSGSGAPRGPSPRPRARPRPGTRRSPRRHGWARSRGSWPRASGTTHCHWVRPATRALVSSELMTGLPRTCSRIAAYVGRARSTSRRRAFSTPPWLIASPNTSRHTSTSRS